MAKIELQTGLALRLPTYNYQKGFDFENKEIVVAVEKYSSHWNNNATTYTLDGHKFFNKKRLFEEAFVEQSNIELPFLLWSGQPNEEDDRKRITRASSRAFTRDDEVQSQIVGWPPLNSWRKKLLHGDRQHIDCRHGQDRLHHMVAKDR
ncbi:hypothetical protein ACFE04_017810 [Oxalis oulophora]